MSCKASLFSLRLLILAFSSVLSFIPPPELVEDLPLPPPAPSSTSVLISWYSSAKLALFCGPVRLRTLTPTPSKDLLLAVGACLDPSELVTFLLVTLEPDDPVPLLDELLLLVVDDWVEVDGNEVGLGGRRGACHEEQINSNSVILN